MSEQNLLKTEELIGKTVVNMKAEKIGEVKNVAYEPNGKKALVVSSLEGVDKIYPFDQAVAIKDVVLLDENKIPTTLLRTPVPAAPQVSSRTIPTFVNQPPPIPRFTDPIAKMPGISTKICPTCKRENRLHSKFCVQCGKPL